MNPSILVVDDERAFVDSVVRMLRLEGYNNYSAVTDSTTVPDLLARQAFDVAFLDITMPGLDGLDLLRIIKERSPRTECIMITANESISLVIKSIQAGAYDYLVKPITPDQLLLALDRALERRRLVEALALKSEMALEQALEDPAAFGEILTNDRGMLRLLREAELHADSEIPILVTGETGTGKELLARAIHRCSRRAEGAFVPVNMLALSPTLFESEFFGQARGAFTGADRDRAGFLDRARGGTLFLDEIGDLSLEIQGKLLRVLQEGEYVPVGRTRPRQADVRFVAGTNQDLARQVQQRRFRKDLLYRLQFAHLHLPPLRRRRGDIPLLAAHFLESSSRTGVTLSEQAEVLLLSNGWPGNVRELKGAMEAAANLAQGGPIRPKHLRLDSKGAPELVTGQRVQVGAMEPLADVERRHILAVYEAAGHNKSKAARVLKIGLQTLHRKLKAYGAR